MKSWTMALGALVLVFVFSITGMAFCSDIRGSGKVVQENRTLGKFDSIELDVPVYLYIDKTIQTPLMIKGDDNILPLIVTEVSGTTLKIRAKDKSIHPTQLVIQVGIEALRGLTLSGAGTVTIRGDFTGDELKILVDGSGSIVGEKSIAVKRCTIGIDGSAEIALDLNVSNLDTAIDGSGDISLKGKANAHRISIDGSGDVKALSLLTDETKVQIDGVGDCGVYATQKLDITIDGAGDVQYKGSPSVTRSIDGVGSVKAI